MTKAQEEAFERVDEIMKEHFDAGVFIVQVEDEEDFNVKDIKGRIHGGFACSVGLLEMYKVFLLRDDDSPKFRKDD